MMTEEADKEDVGGKPFKRVHNSPHKVEEVAKLFKLVSRADDGDREKTEKEKKGKGQGKEGE